MWVPHFGLDPDTDDPLEQEALENGHVIAGERLERSESFLITDLLFSYDFKLTRETTLQVYAGYVYGPYQSRTFNVGIRIGNLFN